MMASLCVIERRDIFKELLSMAASVNECLRSRILEGSPKPSKVLTVMKHYKKISVLKLRLEIATEAFQNKL